MGAKANNPRSGSMQFWPRVRAKKIVPRTRYFAKIKDVKISGFAGFKVGMTHVIYREVKKTARFAGEEVSIPTTIIECPPLKIFAIRFYTEDSYGLHVAKDVINPKVDKEVAMVINLPKAHHSIDNHDHTKYSDLRLLVYTQPKLTGIGQKKPSVFEIAVGGSSVEEKLKFAKDHLDKEIKISDVFKEGEFVDVSAVTKGKGLQGPVKRFGISRKQHKSEKGTRRPGSTNGGWCAQGHMMYRVAKSGKMGFHTRTAYNIKIIKISDNLDDIKVDGGHLQYGVVKNTYILVKGSVPGSRKRLIRLNSPTRPTRNNVPTPIPLEYIDLHSKQ